AVTARYSGIVTVRLASVLACAVSILYAQGRPARLPRFGITACRSTQERWHRRHSVIQRSTQALISVASGQIGLVMRKRRISPVISSSARAGAGVGVATCSCGTREQESCTATFRWAHLTLARTELKTVALQSSIPARVSARTVDY